MANENLAVKLCVENVQTLIERQLQNVLKKESLSQINEAISKVFGGKKDISKLPLVIRINVGKSFHMHHEGGKNILTTNVHKVSCTCINSFEDTEHLLQEKETDESTFTIRYHFYLPELLRATSKKHPGRD